MKKKLVTLILTTILMLTFASPALAQGPDGAKIIFGESFTLDAEKTLDSDLVVFGGDVALKPGSTLTGDMAVFGGDVTIDGTVKGDIGLIGGNANIGETAVIEGDVGLLGGHASISDQAVVKGEVKSVNELNYQYDEERHHDDDSFSAVPPIPPTPPVPHVGGSFRGPDVFGWLGRVVSDIFWNISLLVTLGLIGWLVAAFMPEQMMNVRQAVTDSTALSFGLGLMTSVVAVVVSPIAFLLLVTICLALLPIAGYTLLGVAMLFGWIVIGQVVGERLLSTNGRPLPGLVAATLVGVLVLTLITNMPVIGQVPLLGFLLSLVGSVVGLVVAITGLGAVLLTRFGTRSYPAPAYSFGGGGGGGPRYAGGARVRWTDPEPEVSDEEPSASEVELNAKIKSALAEADKATKGEPLPEDTPEDDPPAGDNTPKDESKEKKRKPRPKKPADDEPEA